MGASTAALRKRGGIILQSCAARGFERTGGRITAVVTERGTVRCGAVVLAGGVWSSLMARSLGLDLPQFMAFGSVLRLGPVPGPDTALISAEHGIGSLKAAKLPHYKSPVALTMMRAIKRALDPQGLMNPGRVLAPPP